ncbi:MAG: hypothetical protein ACFFCQ_15560 [Promethearchaeota archaeon]
MDKTTGMIKGVFDLISDKTTSAMTSELQKYLKEVKYPSRTISRGEMAKDLQDLCTRLSKVNKQIIESTQIQVVKVLYRHLEGKMERKDIMRLFDGLDLLIESKIETTRKQFAKEFLPNFIQPRKTKILLTNFGEQLIKVNKRELNLVSEKLVNFIKQNQIEVSAFLRDIINF